MKVSSEGRERSNQPDTVCKVRPHEFAKVSRNVTHDLTADVVRAFCPQARDLTSAVRRSGSERSAATQSDLYEPVTGRHSTDDEWPGGLRRLLNASTLVGMSDAVTHDDAGDGLTVVPLDVGMRIAKPWTLDRTTGIEDVSDEEWDAFIEALKNR